MQFICGQWWYSQYVCLLYSSAVDSAYVVVSSLFSPLSYHLKTLWRSETVFAQNLRMWTDGSVSIWNYSPSTAGTSAFVYYSRCAHTVSNHAPNHHAPNHLPSHTHSHKYVVQGTSRDNRKGWLESMEGKEPVYSSLKVMESECLVWLATCASIQECAIYCVHVY